MTGNDWSDTPEKVAIDKALAEQEKINQLAWEKMFDFLAVEIYKVKDEIAVYKKKVEKLENLLQDNKQTIRDQELEIERLTNAVINWEAKEAD